MPVVQLAAKAASDIDRIVREISYDNPTAATRWFRELSNLFDLLAAQSLIGERYRTRRLRSARRIPYGNYLVYYVPVDDGVNVVRIVHGARNQRGLI